jgi:hypothetical protein
VLDPLTSYYAEGPDAVAAGRVRGAGAAGFGLHSAVAPAQLERLLAGRHPTTDAVLLAPGGSAGPGEGAPQGLVPVSDHGADDELLSVAQAAWLIGVTPPTFAVSPNSTTPPPSRWPTRWATT